MLLPFTWSDAPAVVAGRTSYAANVVGTALTTIDFMYFPNADHAGATSNFYANNVAFRRDVFEQHSYQALDGVYRAHCQVLGMRLKAAGVPIHYAAQAHTEHRLPDTRAEALKLRWMRGQDTYSLTPHPAAQLRIAALAVAREERADRAAGRAVHPAGVQREGAQSSRPAAAAPAALARGRGVDPRLLGGRHAGCVRARHRVAHHGQHQRRRAGAFVSPALNAFRAFLLFQKNNKTRTCQFALHSSLAS